MKKLVDFAKNSNHIGDGMKIIQQSEYPTINSQRKVYMHQKIFRLVKK